MQYESINRINIAFDKGDIVEYNVSGGTYSASIALRTVDGKTAELKFDNTAELRSFIEHIIHSALKMDWSLNYPSEWHRVSEEVASLTDVAIWKARFVEQTEQEQDVMPPF